MFLFSTVPSSSWQRVKSKQRGVALLTALLIVALATIAATALLKQQYLHIRRSANVLQGLQADAYVQGG